MRSVAPGEGAAELASRAVAAGVITDARSEPCCASQRELAARVVRVDDFAQDLGTSLLHAATSSDAGGHADALARRSAGRVRRARRMTRSTAPAVA